LAGLAGLILLWRVNPEKPDTLSADINGVAINDDNFAVHIGCRNRSRQAQTQPKDQKTEPHDGHVGRKSKARNKFC
jgi:hypothetical protein